MAADEPDDIASEAQPAASDRSAALQSLAALSPRNGIQLAKPSTRLSPREHDVLLAYLSGGSADAVATRLNISKNTVRNHLRGLMGKYEVTSGVELVCKALGVLGEDRAKLMRRIAPVTKPSNTRGT